MNPNTSSALRFIISRLKAVEELISFREELANTVSGPDTSEKVDVVKERLEALERILEAAQLEIELVKEALPVAHEELEVRAHPLNNGYSL